MIVVSACLAGISCRFDGNAKPCEEVINLVKQKKAVPACPECMAGLKLPRPPAEICGGDGRDVLTGRAEVYNKDKVCVTEDFIKGAEKFVAFVKKHNAPYVMLKSKSPSCGVSTIYDGSFSGSLRKGCGVACALLEQSGIRVVEVD